MQPLFAIETQQARWARRLSGVIALWCFGLLAYGFYLQHVSGLEPCPMCAGALQWSQISRVVFGASDPKRGAMSFKPTLFHPSTEIIGGIEKDACLHLLTSFFRDKRQ